MLETQENQEGEDTTEEIIEEAPAKTIKELAEAVNADASFIHGDNENFYLAFKAYHNDRDYEEAIQKFQAAIEYERAHPRHSGTYDVDVIAKSRYWTGESYIKIKAFDKAIEELESLASDFMTHYLGLAAQRRIEALKSSH